MFRSVSSALVLAALSISVTAFGVGCAGQAEEDANAADGAASASGIAHDYEGTIGSLKVFLRLDAQGSNVTGSYFYADKKGNGDTLKLSGTIANGKLSLTEKVNGAGNPTGTFEGTVGAAGITGTWKGGTSKLPLALKPITSLKTALRKYSVTGPKVTDSDYGRQCSLDAEQLEVFGLDAKIEKAIGEKLAIEPLDNADGKCISDIRTINHEVKMNAKGFLTVHVSTEYDGGAHPENASEYFNFDLKTGAHVGPNEIFAAGSEAKVKALVEAEIKAGRGQIFDGENISEDVLESFNQQWSEDTKLENIQMGFGEKGLTIDMGNNYPHVILAIAPVVEIPWASIKPLMKAGSPAAAMTN